MKGKHAAAAANRRLHDANERVVDLEQSLQDAKADHRRREQGLRAELDQLRGRFTAGVREQSAARVTQAHEDARQRVMAAEHASQERSKRLLAYIFRKRPDIDFTAEDWTHLADIAGLTMGEVMACDPSVALNHRSRRISAKQARRVHSMREEHPA